MSIFSKKELPVSNFRILLILNFDELQFEILLYIDYEDFQRRSFCCEMFYLIELYVLE